MPLLWIAAGLLATFIMLATTASMVSGPWFFDGPILLALESIRSDLLTEIITLLTDLGGHHVMIPVGIVFAGVALWRRRRTGIFVAVALLGSALLNEAIKFLVNRPRPSMVEALSEPRGLSFPSGHSQASMALAFTLVLVLWRMGLRDRSKLGVFFLFPLLVGASRAYLGVHYPSDIIAGWILGCASALLAHTVIPETPQGPAHDKAAQSAT